MIAGGESLVSHAGATLLIETARRSGLARQLSRLLGIGTIVSGEFTERLARKLRKDRERDRVKVTIKDKDGEIVAVMDSDTENTDLAHELVERLREGDRAEVSIERGDGEAREL